MQKTIFSALFLLFISTLFAQNINVSNATQLQNALNVATAGQTIVLADGIYTRSAGFIVPVNLHGTAANPIILKGSVNAILTTGNTNSGYSLGLSGNNYWRLEGFSVRGSKKGIVIDKSKYVTVKNVRCTQMGEEGIHLRTYSSFDTIRGCWLDSLGLVTPGFGEGIYVGSSESNWATYTAGLPDTCNYNVLINNTFGAYVRAENIDIKEGTKGGWVLNNSFNGAGLSNQNSADSWIDVKGNFYTINENTGKNTTLDGFQTHIEYAGFGNYNSFAKNVLTVNNSLGYGINIKTSNANGTALNNTVCNNNEVRSTPFGLTNIATTHCGDMERSMYVDDFDTVINSASAKITLLQYAKSHKITYLILYDLYTVHNQHNLTNAATNQILADFIADAKNNYGITKIAAAGENASFFQTRILAYNNTRSNPKEKFDVLGMEFEFWTPSLTNSGGFYCDDYLIPNALPCDSVGAFAFCKSQLLQMRMMADASSHPLTVEMYVGWLNAGQMKIIAGLVDRMLVHAYVTNPTTSYTYALTRLQNYATINGMENVTIIFSAEPNFMGPWLNTNSLQSAEQTFLNAYNAASGSWKSHVNLQGFTYFTYSMMAAAPLKSTYLAYDAMSNSANTPLHNSTGGTGWAAPWDVQNAPSVGYLFNTNPLTYSNLQNFGGSADGGQVYLTAGRALNVADGGPFDAYVTGTNLIGSTTGTILYTSAILQKKLSNGQPIFMDLHNSTAAWCNGCTSNKVAFGYFGSASDVGGQRRWSLRIGTTVYPSSVPVTIGQSAFFVLKISFNSGNTVLDLYVNPTSLGTAGLPASSSLSQTTTTLIRIRSCAVYLGDVAGNGAIDEIRFASSYSVAAPNNSVVLNLPPTGSFTMSATNGTAPLTVNFDASASIDPEGQPLTYTWNFGDGTPSLSGSSVVSHAFANGLVGQIPITLTVKDDINQLHSPNKILTIYTPGTTTFPCQSTITNLREATCGQNNGRISINANNATFSLKNAFGASLSPTTGSEFHNLAAGNYNVTITGSNGCVDTYNLKMTTDSTTCAGWQAPMCNMAMGVNVNGIADWSWEHAFINRAKHLRENLVTFHTGSGWDTNAEYELTLDADGYPTSIPQATSANTQTKVRFILSSDNGNLKANEQYVFLYDGIGSFTVSGVIVNSNTSGRVLFTVPNSSGNIWIDVNSSQSGNYMRNFRLIKADEENLNPNIAIFNQTFLSRLSPFKALRFMDWGHTNGSPHVSWANRTKATKRTYGGDRGVPYEMMIALGNQARKDIWVCVPHQADSNYIAEMAKLFRDNLDPNLTIYLEYSNEVWNWLFSQAHYNNENRPVNLGYGRAYAEKAKKTFQIWSSVFTGQTNRIKRTLGLQGGNNGLNQDMMSQLSQNDWDVASPSYYFGLDHSATGNPVLTANSTGDDVNLNARNAYFGTNGWLSILKQDYRNIKIFGKEINSYEGGQHYTDFNTHPYQQAMYNAQYLPSIYSLYDNVLDTIRNMGNKLAMSFTLSGVQESVYGSWGHLPNMYLNPPYMATAPKYQAVLDNSCLPFQNTNTYGLLNAKVFLNHVNSQTGLMDNYVTTLQSFPSQNPYETAPFNSIFTKVNDPETAKINASLLSQTGNNAIVDWVFLELRSGTSGATTVIKTRTTLLQRDGDLVETDGISPVTFSLPNGAYYVTVRHRNHLGFRTLQTYSLTQIPTNLNFTNNSVALFGVTPLKNTTPSIYIMNGGDGNSDGSIDAADSALWELQNGSFDDYYFNTDYNLDGSIDAVDSAIWEINNGKYEELN